MNKPFMYDDQRLVKNLLKLEDTPWDQTLVEETCELLQNCTPSKTVKELIKDFPENNVTKKNCKIQLMLAWTRSKAQPSDEGNYIL